MVDLIQRVKKNILENNLIAKGDRILVAFSGGPDSTALIHILHELSGKMKFSMAACYINHMIRRRAVKNEIKFCWSVCEKLNTDFHIINEDIPRLAEETKQSVETAAREFRRAVLTQLSEEHGCTGIATGHHLDDTVETILFRLFRGTGPQGLDPIKPRSGKFIRPLYNIERSEIEQYLKRRRVRPLLDRSNLESKYSRNYIRNKIIPVIKKHFGSKYRDSIANFADIVSEENSFLKQITEKELKKISNISPGGKIIVDLRKLGNYDVWLKRRLVKQALEKLSGRPGTGSFEDIERIGRIIDGTLKAASLTDNMKAGRDNDYLFFYNRRVDISKRNLQLPGSTGIPEINSRIRSTLMPEREAVMNVQKKGLRVDIDYSKISPPLYVRGIRAGDRFAPLGMKGTKKIGDFLTDRKISRFIRDEIPVVLDEAGIIWLVGHQIADRVKIDQATKKVLGIEIVGKRFSGSPQV